MVIEIAYDHAMNLLKIHYITGYIQTMREEADPMVSRIEHGPLYSLFMNIFLSLQTHPICRRINIKFLESLLAMSAKYYKTCENKIPNKKEMSGTE